MKRKFWWIVSLSLILPLFVEAQTDTSFKQPVSVKYSHAQQKDFGEFKKLVIDYNDRIYVLTDKALLRATGKELAEDRLYRPLAGKRPIDITVQEGTGFLYYLYETAYLSNTSAGIPHGEFKLGEFDRITVAKDGAVLLTGKSGAVFHQGNSRVIPLPPGNVIASEAYKGTFYTLTSEGIYRLCNDQYRELKAGKDFRSFTFWENQLIVGTSKGYLGINPQTGTLTTQLQLKIPIQEINTIKTVDGKLWAGTPNGAFMKKADKGFRYYASKRWVNEDNVKQIAADGAGNVFLMTPSGLNQIQFLDYSYGQKARYFEQEIRQRHIRYGFLARIQLDPPGDLASAQMADTDNDGLWTSFYLGGLIFQYAVTKDSEVRQKIWETFQTYERLLSINQLKGFPSRTFEREGYKNSDPEEWRSSPDAGWEWKGTTSSDELVGYIFIAALMDEFVTNTQEEEGRVADFIDQITAHIIDHDYNFVDLDGKPTLWGRWHPDYVNSYAKTISDRKLASVDLIATLQLAYALTGKERYQTEAFRLMKDHGYLENIMISPFNIKATPGYTYKGIDMGMGPWNHSDDEMEFLSFWVLYRYAFNDDLKKKYAHAIKEFWEIEKPEKIPVWNLITLGTEGSFDKEETLWYLREFPLDRINWTMKNSIRKDLDFLEPNFRSQTTKEVLSPAERAVHYYNTNEFRLDGGDGGKSALTGAEYLLPYWMARYYKVIE